MLLLDMLGLYLQPPWTPDDFKDLIPGNTILDQARREAAARLHYDKDHDYWTEVPVPQFSSPHGPLKIELVRGYTRTGTHYLRIKTRGLRDSRTGRPMDSNEIVEAYQALSGPDATERELLVAARKLYLGVYLHEAEENFRWNGEVVLDPHDDSAVKRAP